MKLKVFLWLIICSLSTHLVAQNVNDDIVKAFEQGQASLLTNHLSEEVSTCILNQQSRVKKQEAVEKIADFFKTIQIQSFKIKHTSVRDESGYIIGSLQSTKDKYRVNCCFKKENNNFFIHQIRIDKANE